MTKKMQEKYAAVIKCEREIYETVNSETKFSFIVWAIQCIAPNTFKTVLRCTNIETGCDAGFIDTINYFTFTKIDGILTAERNYEYTNKCEVQYLHN